MRWIIQYDLFTEKRNQGRSANIRNGALRRKQNNGFFCIKRHSYKHIARKIISNDTNKIPEDKNDVERDVRKCAKKNMIKKRHWLYWLKRKIFSLLDLFLFTTILFDFKNYSQVLREIKSWISSSPFASFIESEKKSI